MSLLDNHDGLLVDLDGTVWNGDTAIEAAISVLNDVDVPVAFVTNNASKPHAAVVEKLQKLGIADEKPTVFNSVDAVKLILARPCWLWGQSGCTKSCAMQAMTS